jgi:hypothetical protein
MPKEQRISGSLLRNVFVLARIVRSVIGAAIAAAA